MRTLIRRPVFYFVLALLLRLPAILWHERWNPDSLAYQAARALVFEGLDQPNGYTEPLLHKYRALAKARG